MGRRFFKAGPVGSDCLFCNAKIGRSVLCVLPAAYYLAARFQDDFEQAVLHAVNGGGQNMSRAMLTGALAGAQVGLSGIPQRFIDGLTEGREIVDLARRIDH